MINYYSLLCSGTHLHIFTPNFYSHILVRGWLVVTLVADSEKPHSNAIQLIMPSS